MRGIFFFMVRGGNFAPRKSKKSYVNTPVVFSLPQILEKDSPLIYIVLSGKLYVKIVSVQNLLPTITA